MIRGAGRLKAAGKHRRLGRKRVRILRREERPRKTFMLRIYMAFQDHLSHIVLIAEEAMLNKLRNAHRNVTPSLIRRGTEQFFSFMKERFENLFGQMEETLLNTVLRIPKNVLLPEDKGQETFRYTAEQFQQLQDEIRQQEQQLQAETQAGWALQAELEEQKLVQSHLEKILQWMEGLDKASREGGTGSLQENFLAMTKTTAKLQSVVQEVEEKSKKLGGKL